MNPEQDDETICICCGLPVSPGLDRSYAIDSADVLCMACGLERGGVYDEGEDRWIVAPRADDLRPTAEAAANP